MGWFGGSLNQAQILCKQQVAGTVLHDYIDSMIVNKEFLHY